MPAPSVSLTDWAWDPSILAAITAVCALYVLAMRRGWLGRGDDLSPWGLTPRLRAGSFAIAVLVCWVALESPIDAISDRYLLWMHMVQHMLLMMVAPPLLILGVAGTAPPVAPLLAPLRRAWRALTRPWAAFFVFTAILLVWHWPAFYDATLRNETLHAVEHLTFIVAGLVLWWPVIDPVRPGGRANLAALPKIFLLGLAGVPSTVLGLIFALANGPYYDFYARAPRLWGTSALVDQQVAGAVMLVLNNLAGFIGITVIFLRMFSSPEEDERAVERELDSRRVPAPERTG